MEFSPNDHTVGRIFYRHHGTIDGVLVTQFAQVLCLGLVLDNFYRKPDLVKKLIQTNGLQYVGINPIAPPLWRLYGNEKQRFYYNFLSPVVKRNLNAVSSQTAILDLENSHGLKDYPVNVPLYTKPDSHKSQRFIFYNVGKFLSNEFNDLDYIYDHGYWYVGQFKSDASVPNGYYIEKMRLADAIRQAFKRHLSNAAQI